LLLISVGVAKAAIHCKLTRSSQKRGFSLTDRVKLTTHYQIYKLKRKSNSPKLSSTLVLSTVGLAVVEMVPAAVVEIVPIEVVEMVPVRVVEIVPTAVVEMVPTRVVEIVPLFENAFPEITNVRSVASAADFIFRIEVLLVIKNRQGPGRLKVIRLRSYSLGSTI